MPEPKIKEKRWSKEFEKEIYELWKKKKVYSFDPNAKKPVFSIDTPPPYVNTPVHIGQVTTYCLMDFFARFRRMIGHNVLFPLGLDRNGLPIELAAEREFKISLKDMPREKFLEYCKRLLEKFSLESVESFLRCGISFNSWEIGTKLGDLYLTDSPEYRALTQATFIDLWKKGLIYEDARVNNYCPGCGTTIADAEIVYKELPTIFNHIKFKIKETGEEVIIATTRPELLCSCAMVIFNPADDRYKHLEGKHAIVPLYNFEVPIKSHPMAAIEKGTGLVMMCSFGDLSDIRFFREQNLKPVIAIDEDGRMNKNAGFLEGLTVKEARAKIVEMLKENNLLVKQEEIMHRTPVCERSGDEIEFIAMPEFYLKQLEFKDKMLEIANQLNFFADESRRILINWINSVSIDWPISRRRYYATEIPIWYCQACGYAYVPEKGKYYQPWKENPPIDKCPNCGSTHFKGETRVFDTWFDSSISPLWILGYERYPEFFEKHVPCSLRPQGKEIVRTWLYYTLLKCYLLTDKAIFKDVWINYHIVDEHGLKMSKSKGNMIDPKEVLDKYGAEPFRLWAAIEGDLTKQDFRCSFERIDGAAKTITKLWNVARFISMFEKPKKPDHLLELDKWIIAEINELVKLARNCYENYDFHLPAVKLKHFLWETFASHYIELVKPRAYNQDGRFNKQEQDSAWYTLHYCLEILLKLLAPILPFITYKIYNILNNKDIHFEKFPEIQEVEKADFTVAELIELNSKVWKYKREKGLSLKDEVLNVTLPEKFKFAERDIIAAHNIKNLTYGKEISIQ